MATEKAKTNKGSRCKLCGYRIRTTYERHVTGAHHSRALAGGGGRKASA